MGCIPSQSPFLSIFSHLKHNRSDTYKLHWFYNHQPSTKLLRRPNLPAPVPLRTQALPLPSLVLGISSSPAATGDISILILTSAVFLFVYWITNFVVPELILKDLQSEKPIEDQIPSNNLQSEKPSEDQIPSSNNNNPLEDDEENMPSSSETSSRMKNRGFKSFKL